jgi:hypothetical protein
LVGEPCGKGAKNRCCTGANCNEDQPGGGICSCPPGRTDCRGFCVDVTSDPSACGKNCAVCPDDTDCCNSVCCKEGQRCCGGACTDLTSDNTNCGGCTQECPPDLTCCDSRCRILETDRHCGACHNACPNDRTCQGGQCVCRPGYRDCGDGVCRNLKTDPQNCGACGRSCGSNQICRNGRCRCAARRVSCAPLEPNRCGRQDDSPCLGNDDCCGGTCVQYGGRLRCRPCLGVPCTEDRQCCQNLTCDQSTGPAEAVRFCGGCRGRRQSCSANEHCCSSDCTPDSPGSTCLSNRDGRCLDDLDCRDCFLNGNCTAVCVGGRCRA